MKYLVVHQDFAHHIQSEPVRQVADMVLFQWPIPLPPGFDRVSTPLVDGSRLAVMEAHWQALCPHPPSPNPQPIPEPQPVDEEPV